LYCGIGSSSLNALVNAFERPHMVRGWNCSVHRFCRLEPVPVSIQQLVRNDDDYTTAEDRIYPGAFSAA